MKKILHILITTLLFCNLAWSAQTTPIHSYKLKNGLNVYVKEDHRAPIATIQVWYKVGSSYEPNGMTGISHVLEHMMFKGTKKHPPEEIDKIITGLGGELNAITGYDATYYLMTIASPLLATVFEIEADRMRHLVLNPEGFAKEIKVVQEERLMRSDNNPQTLAYERFMASAYIAIPYHHAPIGWMNDIQHISLKDLRDWYNKWYVPNNAALVVVGDVDPNQVYQLAQKYFDPLPPGVIPTSKPHTEVPQMGMRYSVIERPARLPWLIMGYLVPSLKTSQNSWEPYALKLIEVTLSGGNSSRLYNHLVSGEEVASSASAMYNPFALYDSLFILEGTPSANHSTEQLKQALLNQIEQLKKEPLSRDELQRIKNQLTASYVFEKDSISTQASDIGTLASLGLPVELSLHFLQEIDKITPQQILEVARKYFNASRLTIGELKPQPINANDAKKQIEATIQGTNHGHHQ